MAYKSIRIFLIGIIIFVANAPSVEAQNNSHWQPDQKIPGYFNDTLTPFLITDQNKTVHAFTSQWVDNGVEQVLAIIYRKWTLASGWTRPIDVVMSPKGNAQLLGAFLDSKGIIHIIFLGNEKSIYYANAMASEAGNVPAWSLPMEVAGRASNPSSGLIMGDNKDNLIILFNGSAVGRGVYAIKSSDAGHSWSDPLPIFLTYDDKLLPFYIKGYMGESGKLHVVWSIVKTLVSGGVDFDFVYYDRFDMEKNQWDKPILLEKKPDAIGFSGVAVPIVVDNGKYVVIMYNAGNPNSGQYVPFGRPSLRVRISTDNGESWEAATSPFPLLTGSSGEFSLVVDSSKHVHAVATMRIDRLVNGQYQDIGGLWHSELIDNVWSDPERISTTVSSHTVRAVISQGNVLLVSWISDPVGEGVWYSYTILNSPELPVVPLPTPDVKPSITQTAVNSLVVATATQDVPLLIDQEDTSYTPAQPLISGSVAAVLLIMFTIIAISFRDRHKR